MVDQMKPFDISPKIFQQWSRCNYTENKVEVDGKVLEIIPGGKFKVQLENGYKIIIYLIDYRI